MENVSYTKIKRGWDIQKQMIQGAIELAEAVVDTMGPSGYTVIIDRPNDDPLVTKDGVTVARHIKLGNPIRNQGAQILKQVANRAQSQSGDGTTTATLLAKVILETILEFEEHTSWAKAKQGMTDALNDITKFLEADSIQIDLETEIGLDIMENVAFISSNNDKMISSLVLEALKHSKGKNPIKINQARGSECYVENMEGMIHYNSVHHDFFLEALGVTNEIVLKNSKLFITDHEINSLSEISSVMTHVWNSFKNEETRYPLIIIAPDINVKALHLMFENMAKLVDENGKRMQIIALKLPEFGVQASYVANEMAIYTGGRAVLKSEFQELQDANTLDPDEILGRAEMHIKRDQYSIINGQYDKDKLQQRINYLDELIEEEESGYMQDKLMQRKAKLMGSISIIFVGAETPVEAEEIHARVDDAVNAVKGALAEGVVKGGGVALYESCYKLDALKQKDVDHLQKDADYIKGYDTILASCFAPFEKIIENSGKSVEAYRNKLLTTNFKEMYNVRTEEVVNIFDAKIFDPKKITVNSLKSAISVASTLMSTRTSITGFVGKSEE
tara:strand:- start:72078 stop:73760 length:1683 start_codon:yes stop_codon:yes gene_type:complete